MTQQKVRTQRMRTQDLEIRKTHEARSESRHNKLQSYKLFIKTSSLRRTWMGSDALQARDEAQMDEMHVMN